MVLDKKAKNTFDKTIIVIILLNLSGLALIANNIGFIL